MGKEEKSKEVKEEPRLQFITTEQMLILRLNNIELMLQELLKIAKNDTV